MTKSPRKKLTDDERHEILDLWSEYQNLRRLAPRFNRENPYDSWLAAATTRRQEEIAHRLDEIFSSTSP